ncbi:hypothetical protein BH18ACI5_BH18ACI5_22570 [soil metagenome]
MSTPAAPVPLDDSYWLIEGQLLDDAFACIKQLRETTPDGWKASPQTEARRALVREWRTRTKR